MKRLCVLVPVVCIAACIQLALVPPPAGADDDGTGGDDDFKSVRWDEAVQVEEAVLGQRGEGRKPDPRNPGDGYERPCAKWDYGDDEDIVIIDPCVERFNCYGDRLDDALTGKSGSGTSRGFEKYVDRYFGEGAGDGVIGDPGSLADHILDVALGDQPDDEAIPVFYYCLNEVNAKIAMSNSEAVDGSNVGPSFRWDATARDEFSIPPSRRILFDRLVAELAAHRPKPQTIPPVEQATVWVQAPTWLWLDEPTTVILLFTESPGQTIRLAARATLVDVTWQLGSTRLVCTPEQMRAYEGGDPFEDPPECHHIWTKLDTFELVATARYRVEEQLATRPTFYGDAEYPDAPWVPHPIQQFIEQDGSAGTMRVHQLLSLNVLRTSAEGEGD